jgi:hypothetical protein
VIAGEILGLYQGAYRSGEFWGLICSCLLIELHRFELILSSPDHVLGLGYSPVAYLGTYLST